MDTSEMHAAKDQISHSKNASKRLRTVGRIFIKLHRSFASSISFSVFILLVISKVDLSTCQSIRGITGSNTPCTEEGAIIKTGFQVEGLQCICMNGNVKCIRRACESTRGCYALMDYIGDDCPVQCQVCKYRGQIRKSSDVWTYQKDDLCKATTCKDGIVTVSREQCYTECNDPTPSVTNDCCPTCKGCRLGNVTHREGATFRHPTNPCVTCQCKAGGLRCSRKPCPVVACPTERRRKVGCCQVCTGQHRRHELQEGQCWKDRGILKNGQSYKADKCTKCTCISGTVVCQRESCPLHIRECREGESPAQEGSCCQICFYKKPRNCDREATLRKHGETWRRAGNPCKQCTCVNGTVSCRTLTCASHPGICKTGGVYDIVPGECCKTCIPAPGICSVFGDPHYRTFDGRPFNFQGDCRYVLAKDCENMNFTVVVQNDAKRSKSFSWTKSVEVELMAMGNMKKTVITLEPHLTCRVNKQKVSLPYLTPYVSMNIEKHVLQVRTAIGVSLNWDGDSFLEVGAAPMYENKLCGLCGNYNTFKRDDFIGGDKTFKFSEVSFGNSWIVDKDSCSRDDYKPDATRCKKSLAQTLKARRSCALFKSQAFSACYDKIDPTEYYKSCVTDSCECPAHKKCACEALVAYTAACGRQDVQVTWNRSYYCKKTCNRGKVFSTCGPACRDTCRNYRRLKHKKCKKKCVAGCHCPAGTVIHRRRCIKVTQCPKYLDKPFSIIISRRNAKRQNSLQHKNPV